VERFFTLYFIPIFSLGDLGEFIECQSCQLTFRPEILGDSFAAGCDGETLDWIRTELDKGLSMKEVRKKLAGSGFDEAVATRLVADTVGEDKKLCKKCIAWYRSTVNRCSSCGSEL
jgi:hypothetical protein